MKKYYIFRGRGDCGSCGPHSGYYTIHPGRPHENCQCTIVVKKRKECDGDWSASGAGGARNLGDGNIEQDLLLEVEQPDGSVDYDIVTVSWPEDMDPEMVMDAIEDALEDRANEISEPCPPFLCV